MTLAQVVEDVDFVPGVQELARGMAANVTGTASNEDFHRRPIPW